MISGNNIQERGFTLLEALIIVVLVSILAVAIILILNPAEAFRRGRDGNRIAHLRFLHKIIPAAATEKDTLALAPSNMCAGESDQRIFVSIPSTQSMPPPPSGWNWTQVTPENLWNTNGTGWLPIDFTGLATIAMEKLPVDPVNTIAGNQFFTYTCKRNPPGFEFNVALESQTYRDTLHLNDGGDTSTRFEVGTILTNSPVAAATLEQIAYRWFNNDNSTNVGSALAAQDTAIANIGQGAIVRLRILLHIDSEELTASAATFRLEYAQRSGTCDTGFVGESYAAVNTVSGTIRFADNSVPADGAILTANASDPTHLSHTVIAERYEEANNTDNVATVAAGQDGKWDFALTNFSAPSATTYCFRMVKVEDGSPVNLNTYNAIPELTTGGEINQTHYRWRNDDGGE